MRVFIPLALVLLALPANAGKTEWAKGVAYTTDFKQAIKEARTTGKILLIYNGWQREKV
ncbi:MAG: hypothetical protein ACYTGZ_06880 [Planctomycetota bacterium]|jgi:hypothetical protein